VVSNIIKINLLIKLTGSRALGNRTPRTTLLLLFIYNADLYLRLKKLEFDTLKVYQNRTKSSFKLRDSIQGNNIHSVYPHSLFCDTTTKDRCITHDNKDIYYFDDDHALLKGTEMINDLIKKKIEKIEFKSN